MRTFTLGTGSGADVVKYSNPEETAKIDTATAKAGIAAALTTAASSADTIYNVKVGDKIDIKAVAGSSAKLVSDGAVIQSNDIASTVTLTNDVNVLLVKNNADYLLVYEKSGAEADDASLGANAEVIKLVGLTDSSKIALDSTNGIVTIAAV